MSTNAADATSTTGSSGTGAKTTSSGTGNADTGKSGVTGRVRGVAGAASTRAADAYSAARERTSATLGTARQTASRATQRASQRVETNPVAAVVGGLALGGLLAWVLPKTQRETEALSGVGHKLTDTARQAAQTALDAGKQQVNEIKETAASSIGHAVMEAVSSSASGGSGQSQQ